MKIQQKWERSIATILSGITIGVMGIVWLPILWAQDDSNPSISPIASHVGTIVDKRTYEIPATSFEWGNAKSFTTQWADAEPMIGFGGEDPWMVEYELPIPVDPVSGGYTISVKYSAAQSRPLTLYFDNERVGDVCGQNFGSWNTSQAQWETVLTRWIAPGRHLLRFTCADGAPPPHLVAIRVEITSDSSVVFPSEWVIDRPRARKLDAPFTSLVRSVVTPTKASVRQMIDDYRTSFSDENFPEMADWIATLDSIPEEEFSEVITTKNPSDKSKELEDLARRVVLANPLLNFDSLIFVERKATSPNLGLPQNWQSNSCISRQGFDDRLARLDWRTGKVETIFQPSEMGQATGAGFVEGLRQASGKFVGDVDLDFDAKRLLFSMLDDKNIWQIWEMNVDGTGLRRLTGQEPDVESYDACYLPNGDIMYTNTGMFVGVPCVNGSSHVAMLYRMERNSDGSCKRIQQLCFEQEHDWCPVILSSGRVLYTRWEYTDTPHANTRLLFSMNPDGTGQMEYVGSNSYWPNSFFYARPMPGSDTKIVSVIGGHHDHPRMGELVIFDPKLGRQEYQSAIQHIPGADKPVPMVIRDGLTLSSWPKFLHPYPLSEKYIIVSCKPSAAANWGIYLVDIFDNFTLLYESENMACLEPIPLQPRPRPPVIADKVDLTKQTATFYIADIYAGNGLQGIPRGTVKSMRIGTYNFAFQEMGGLYGIIGSDGPWDVRRIVGTVPVNPDGSVKFTAPANVPLMFQPLDDKGAALQLMRSWTTAMPGEVVQCTGCHEKQNTTAPVAKSTIAINLPAVEIQSWRGPMRGFSFAREIQPILDHYCIVCHDGTNPNLPNFRGDLKVTDWSSVMPGNGGYTGHAGKFSIGYTELAKYVRRPGIESDYHMLEPMEFHVGTTHLMQRLLGQNGEGHYGVHLDSESLDRLTVWIDFNTPFHGSWSGKEDGITGLRYEKNSEGIERVVDGESLDLTMWDTGRLSQRRRELSIKYANLDDDPEAIIYGEPILTNVPPFIPDSKWVELAKNWSPAANSKEISPENYNTNNIGKSNDSNIASNQSSTEDGKQNEQTPVELERRSVDLGNGISFEMVKIPSGRSYNGQNIPAFWVATLETTNQIYQQYDLRHDSRVEDKPGYQFGIHGIPANLPEQPVVRVSYNESQQFCRWLSEKTGEKFDLPSAQEWEYMALATKEPNSDAIQPAFWFGNLGDDFSKYENLADAKLSEFVTDPYTVDQALANPPKYDDWIPKEARFNDGSLIAVAPGKYQPNPWGLYDLHGNVQEWTKSENASGEQIVCGGSWRDRPSEATIATRRHYQPYQRVFNVGFRVISR